MKHVGGNIMAYGCFAYSEAEEHLILGNTMKSAKYIKSLEDCLQSSVQKLEPVPDWMLKQDIDPKRTAKVTRVWFEHSNIKVMKRLKHSPEMNPIENLRKLLRKNIREKWPKTLNEMKLYAKNEWANFSIKTS